MNNVLSQEYNCEGCGGNLTYDADTQTMLCEYCGSCREVKTNGNKLRLKVPFSKDLEYAGLNDAKHIYKCEFCDTDVASCNDIKVAKCPACGSSKLIETNGSGVHPLNIAPFKISKEKASNIFKKWISNRVFSPNDLKKMAKLKKVTGVYIPTYFYDFKTATDYEVKCYNEYKDSDGDTHKTYYYKSGRSFGNYQNVKIFANDKYDDYYLKKVALGDSLDIRPYSIEYMLGFLGAKTEISVQQSYERLKELAITLEKRRITSDFKKHYDGVARIETNIEISDIFNSYIYLPVWINHFSYKGKDYKCFINGQDGTIYGKTPKSFWKIFGLVVGVIAGIVLTTLGVRLLTSL